MSNHQKIPVTNPIIHSTSFYALFYVFQWIGLVGKILTGNTMGFYHQIVWGFMGFRVKIVPSPIL